jgi:NTE family protein
MRKDGGYCLVLGGGGAKGVYHIGAWRALKELELPIDAFIGNSIGAIIGAFLAQGSDSALEELGASISLGSILALDPSSRAKAPGERVRGWIDTFKSFVDKGGLDTSPLKSLLQTYLDEERLRASGVDLGILTVNVTDMKPREVFLEDMEKGSLVRYLLASSAFPGFVKPEIDGKQYVDGGLYDNVPYNTARKRGYRRIIVLDISGAGFSRKPDILGTETIYIKNSVDLGGTLDFDRSFLDAFTRLGYLDVMRTFGRYVGYSYFLLKDDVSERGYRRFLEDHRLPTAVFPESMRCDRRILLKHLECAASILGVERIRVYSYAELAAQIEERRAAVEKAVEEALAFAGKGSLGTAMRLKALIGDIVRKGRHDQCAYYYATLVRRSCTGKTLALLEGTLNAFFPALSAGTEYLEKAGIYLPRGR